MPDDSKEPKEYFINRLREQADEMEEEANNLEVRLDESDWDPKLDYEKQIDEMKIASGTSGSGCPSRIRGPAGLGDDVQRNRG